VAARLVQLEKLPTKPSSFHPKSWHIVDSDGAHLVIGSSNLSRSALRDGLEWNLMVSGDGSRTARRDALAAFNQLWDCASKLSTQLLDSYQKAYSTFLRTQFHPTPQEAGEPLPLPRPWQIKALEALSDLRAHQWERAVVTVATGMGKTWLAAFDKKSGEMRWKFEDCIAHVARSETIVPGEFFGSGTVGSGCGLEQMRFLKPGDVVELEVEGIGILRNRFIKP
jgi:hypothetical protein